MVSKYIIIVHRIFPFGPLVCGMDAGVFICYAFAVIKTNPVDNTNAFYYSVHMTKIFLSELYL